MEQYNFDVIEEMELKVFNRWRGLYGSKVMESEGTGLTHVCQTTLSSQCEGDTVGVEPSVDVFMGKHDVTAGAVSPYARSYGEAYNRGTVLSDEGNISDSDGGSIEDCERDT